MDSLISSLNRALVSVSGAGCHCPTDSVQASETPQSAVPFSIYSSVHVQHLSNVPIVRPVLILVLNGEKEVVRGPSLASNRLLCKRGEFVFLSDSPSTNMRNIPLNQEYRALLIEFEYSDFEGVPVSEGEPVDAIVGRASPAIESCIQQFVEATHWAPESLWTLRRKEILMMLYYQGHTQVASMMDKPKLAHRVHDLVIADPLMDTSVEELCERLAMSESSLRRKLKQEGTGVQDIKDAARMGMAMHLLQTSMDTVQQIADRCGYQSHSRFTERFKSRFGLTPSQLRKTKMME
jgi:AraC-like DNA-binding protein